MEMPVSDALAEDTALGNLSASESKGTEDILPNSIDDIRPIKVIQQLYAQRALSLHGGSLRQTALALGVAVNTLRTWLKQK